MIGAFLGVEFVALTLFYMVLSLAYSLKLKRLRWIDIAMLAPVQERMAFSPGRKAKS